MISSSSQKWEPTLLKRGLVRDHEKEEDKQEPYAPRRASGAVERVPLRQRGEERDQAVAREAVDDEEEDDRDDHEVELHLGRYVLYHGLIVDVP